MSQTTSADNRPSARASRLARPLSLAFCALLAACVGSELVPPGSDDDAQDSTFGPGFDTEPDAPEDTDASEDPAEDSAPDTGGDADVADVAPDVPEDTAQDGSGDAALDTDVEETGPECGNGIKEGEEECDDGNANDGDGCDSDCIIRGEALCGECNVDADCGTRWDLCLDTGGELRCGLDCSRPGSSCPQGYICRAIADGGVIIGRQCRPSDTVCAVACVDDDDDGVCNDEDICAGGDDNIDVNTNGIPDACEVGSEDCTNGIDDDGDSSIDCADPSCLASPDCEGAEICNNAEDDDGDLFSDCADPDCETSPLCGRDEICDNDRDDDFDGKLDCEDTDCWDDPICPRPEVCNNGRDDDHDGDTDCDDEDCWTELVCASTEICDNDRDDDLDRLVDCDDSECDGHPACPFDEVCNNGRDDDFDSKSDCDDPDCWDDPLCYRPEVCDNNRDDDFDGKTDCEDTTDCYDDPACPLPEVCDNDRDDDFDGDTDCDDDDCYDDLNCPLPESCNNDRDDDFDGDTDCDDEDCWTFPLCATAEVCDNDRDDDIDGDTDCDDEDCWVNPICSRPEICFNGYDDDFNGDTDCEDVACSSLPACIPPPGDTCGDPAIRDGYGSVVGPADRLNDDYETTCRTGTGGDAVVRFTAPETTFVCLTTTGSDFDTVLSVRSTCGSAATTLACDDNSGGGSAAAIELSMSEGETYNVLVDSVGPLSGNYRLAMRPGACIQGAGETCENPFTASVGTQTGSTIGGVHSYSGYCADNTAPDHVYAFTAPATGSYCVDLAGSGYDTQLYVQTTCGERTSSVGCNDDSPLDSTSRVELGARAGETYYIFVDGFSSASGTYSLDIRDGACDAARYDYCEGEPITGVGSWDGTTASSAGNYNGTCASAGADIVYAWTAPKAGTYCADTIGTAFNAAIYATAGCGFGATEVACSTGASAAIELDVEAGETLSLVVDGTTAGEKGAFRMNVNEGPCP